MCMHIKTQALAWYFSMDFTPWASLAIFEGFKPASAKHMYTQINWLQCFTFTNANHICSDIHSLFFLTFVAFSRQKTFQKSFKTVSKFTKKSLWPICLWIVEKPTKKLSICLFNFKESTLTFLSVSSFFEFSCKFFGHRRKDPCVWVIAFSSAQVEISCYRFSGFRWKKNIYIYIYIGCGPLTVAVVNASLMGFPIKNVIILVVTVTVRGPHPIYIYIFVAGSDGFI